MVCSIAAEQKTRGTRSSRNHFLLTIICKVFLLLTIISLMKNTRSFIRSDNVTSSDIISSTPPSKQKKPLPLYIQKAFLQDIEKVGGIRSGKVAKVCDLDPGLYGKPGSIERRKIQNKVDRWQKLSQDEFQEVRNFILLGRILPDNISASRAPVIKDISFNPPSIKSPSTLPSYIKSSSTIPSKRLSFSPRFVKKENPEATMRKFAENDGYFKMTGDENHRKYIILLFKSILPSLPFTFTYYLSYLSCLIITSINIIII